MPHLASTVLLGTVVQLPALLLLLVQQEASLFAARPTVQCAPLVTCVHHPSRELFAVHLALTRLARQGKRIALIVLQGFVALIQSECFFFTYSPYLLAREYWLYNEFERRKFDSAILSKGVTTETLGQGLAQSISARPSVRDIPSSIPAVSSFKYP